MLRKKIQIFQKKCRKSTYEKQHFFINGNKIEIVNNYTYLGINVTSNGNFRINKINLMEKTRRSIFATRRYLDFSKLPVHLANKMFDSLFLPILTYGSEVWGAYNKDDFSSWEKRYQRKDTCFLLQTISLELVSDAQMRPVEMN